MMILMIVMMILMTDLYPGVMLKPGQELLLGADPRHPQLPPLGGHQHAVSADMSYESKHEQQIRIQLSVPVACGPVHQVSVAGGQALHGVLHPGDEQVLRILAPEDDNVSDHGVLVSSSHVRRPVLGRGAQVVAQLVGVVGVEEDL